MSAAITNVAGTDIVDLTVEQSSSSRTEVFLEEPLLDATKDYMVSCVELAVPLSEEPMITYDLLQRDLLTIRRRKIGAAPNTAADLVTPTYSPQLSLNSTMKIFTPSDFLQQVAQWAANFSHKCYTIGFPAGFVNDTILAAHNTEDNLNMRPTHNNAILRATITPSGVLQLVGSILFWRNFYVVANSYAQTLMGLEHSTVAWTKAGDDDLTPGPEPLTTGGLIITSNFDLGEANLAYIGQYSLFRFLEERMYLSLEAGDLSLPFNALIRDGTETKSHVLATFPFETHYKTTIKTQNGKLISSIELEMDTHISRTHFQSKTEPSFSWHPLTSSYMVQNMRLDLFITRRRYVNSKWIYQRTPVNIHQDGVWSCSLKFISSH